MKLVHCVAAFLLVAVPSVVWAELPPPEHSLDAFARNVFEAFKRNDFAAFRRHTVFALDEERFKRFLFEVRNDEIRNSLTKGQWSQWKEKTRIQRNPISEEIKKKEEQIRKEVADYSATQAEIRILQAKIIKLETDLIKKWALVCAKKWREHYTRLKSIGSSTRLEAFAPIMSGAEKEGIQWKTAQLTAVEELHEISYAKKKFRIDGDEAPVLHWDPGLTYRLHFDKTMHGQVFRLATLAEGPTPYERGITREGIGDRDFLARFETAPSSLYYFCPDKKGMGNRIRFSDQRTQLRHNVLLTFTYGVPQHSYRILLRDCLPIPADSTTRAGTIWNRWLTFERPVWLGPVSKEPSIE